MIFDIVRALRKKGVTAVDAELSPGLYSWLTTDLHAADEWALLIAGLKEPIRGEIRLLQAGQSFNLYRDPKARSEVGLVLAREPGQLLGKTVKHHLQVVAQLRDDQQLLQHIELSDSFLERQSETLNEFEIRRLHLELAFATRDLKSLIIVEPQLHPYLSWAPRLSKLKQKGIFIHLLTCNPARAQLMSANVIYAETKAPAQKTETFELCIQSSHPEALSQQLDRLVPDFKYHVKEHQLIFEPLAREPFLSLQASLIDPNLVIDEWQVSSR